MDAKLTLAPTDPALRARQTDLAALVALRADGDAARFAREFSLARNLSPAEDDRRVSRPEPSRNADTGRDASRDPVSDSPQDTGRDIEANARPERAADDREPRAVERADGRDDTRGANRPTAGDDAEAKADTPSPDTVPDDAGRRAATDEGDGTEMADGRDLSAEAPAATPALGAADAPHAAAPHTSIATAITIANLASSLSTPDPASLGPTGGGTAKTTNAAAHQATAPGVPGPMGPGAALSAPSAPRDGAPVPAPGTAASGQNAAAGEAAKTPLAPALLSGLDPAESGESAPRIDIAARSGQARTPQNGADATVTVTPGRDPATGTAGVLAHQTAFTVTALRDGVSQTTGPATGAGPAAIVSAPASASSAGDGGLGQAGFGLPSHAANAGAEARALHQTAASNPAFQRLLDHANAADQVSLHLSRGAREQLDQISIQLKPAALGRVDVRLEVAHDGRVQAVIVADRADTLDMLQRDARALERALQDAGLKTDGGSLNFQLNRHDGDNQPGRGAENGGPKTGGAADMETGADAGPTAAPAARHIVAPGRIDVTV